MRLNKRERGNEETATGITKEREPTYLALFFYAGIDSIMHAEIGRNFKQLDCLIASWLHPRLVASPFFLWHDLSINYSKQWHMFRKVNWRHSLTFGVIAGVLFCIPAAIYIYRASYRQSWLLYLGSMFFFLVIVSGILFFNPKRDGNGSTAAMVLESHVTTLTGVTVALIGSLVLLMIMVPGFFDAGMAEKQLTNAPANTIHDKTNGLNFKVFALAFLANFSFGSFASIVFPFTAKRNQTSDRRDSPPLQQGGPK